MVQEPSAKNTILNCSHPPSFLASVWRGRAFAGSPMPPPLSAVRGKRGRAGCFVLSAASHFAGLGIDADDFAFLDKKRHAYGKAGFERGLFGRAAGCGVA